ncbi:MAG: PAS domain-containing protein, partial [Betaproteobacteria bacterium]
HAMEVQQLRGDSERWWNAVNAPILDAQGRVQLIVHRLEDATEVVRLRKMEQEARARIEAERARIEHDLRASEVLESITDGFIALDREFRFEYVNHEAELILGIARADLIGQSIWDAYPGLKDTDFGRLYRNVMDTRQPGSATGYYEPHRRWYDVHVYPAPRGVAIYFRNVTEQRRAQDEFEQLALESETQRRIYEVVLSNTPDLVFIFGLDHRFIYANESLLNMWGIPREQALGKTTWELGYPEWEAAMHDREIEEVVATRKPIHGEVPFEGTTGRRVWDYIFAPVIGPGGDVVAIAGTARDTTDRRTAEEAIAAQAERLRQSDRAKDEFIATLSHELRNPLAPLRNSVAILRMKSQGEPEAARLGEMMERQVNHLVRLVDDLLEISRINRGDFALRRERVRLQEVVRNALETCAPALQARKHMLELSQPDAPIWVDADSVRLAQVIANLVDNAAKYTPDGGHIAVRLSVQEREATVAVKDNGAGISSEGLLHVFEMFNRGDRAPMLTEGGLGIGLALAKRLVDMHGGTLGAASEGLGKGSEFTLRLPLSTADAADAGAATPQSALGRKRVLVVDDNKDAADTLGIMLREMGAEVQVAHDGEEALDAFARFRPSAVLLDIGMPRMNGYEVARELRARFPDVPVSLIALTGWGQEEDRTRARDAGFDHHIVKPANLDELQALLASV